MTERLQHHTKSEQVVQWIKDNFSVDGVITLHQHEANYLFDAMYHGEKQSPLQLTREEMLSLITEFRKIEMDQPTDELWYEVSGARPTELGC